MIQSDYHLHCNYCDGKNSLEEMVSHAYLKGMRSVGVSPHFPLKYPNDWTMTEERFCDYIEAIQHLKLQCPQDRELYIGTEIDYYLDTMDFSESANNKLHIFDYFIGSIHTMGCFANGESADIDGSVDNFEQGLQILYNHDIRQLVEKYFIGIAEMVKKYQPTIIGHFDIIKKNNVDQRFFDENSKWYIALWQECLEVIKTSDSLVEVNTGGIARYGNDLLYPSVNILQRICELNIPITVNSDAHDVKHIGFQFEEIAELLKNIGFKKYYILKQNQIKDISL